MLRQLEKYELLEEIGHGGMATVYRGRDMRLDRMVAVKVLHPHLQKAPEARIRFTREAKSVARLKHPNILEIYDYSGEDSAESYIAAELLTGPTLKRFVEDQQPDMPAEIAACFAIQIARALGAAHEQGIVHRDVKPENVLLHENRCVKLTDFGIAQMVDSQSFTATGQILGSPGHMAPEQVEGVDIDERSDIFSLGTVLYFLAVGRLPFTGKNPHHVLKRIMDADFPDPLRVKPTIGGELSGIITRSMARDPAQRFASVAEMEDALRTFLWRSGVEDADVLLERYLKRPVEVALELREQVVANLISLGRDALSQGDRTRALDAFNRVLALDEGNEEVLRHIERIGKSDRRPTYLAITLGGLTIASIVFVALTREEPTVMADRDAGASERIVAEADSGSPALDSAPAEAPDSGTQDEPDTGPTDEVAVRMSPTRVGHRTVTIVPIPSGVQIAIDEEPLRLYDSTLLAHEMTTGRHTVRVVPNGEPPCCEELIETFTVPPGDGPHRVELRLPLKPAYLSINSGGQAFDLTLHGLPGTHRTNGLVRVPLRRLSESRSFVVTGPGYAEYTGTVELRAGASTEVTVRLEPRAEAP